MEENKIKELILTATHEQDTPRFRRYSVDEEGQPAIGRIYISKEIEEPERVVLVLRRGDSKEPSEEETAGKD